MKIIVDSIPLYHLSKTVDVIKQMENFNHSLEYVVHSKPDIQIFNLAICSERLTIAADAYKIIITDILPDIKIKFETDEVVSVSII